MATTTNPILMSQDFFRSLPDAFMEGEKIAVRMLWNGLMPILRGNWIMILGIIFVIFVIFTFKAMLGRWGSLGSFLYNFFYFGTLLVIGLIWGPEVFVGDFFKATCTAILYPVCYWLSGYIMDRMGVRRRRR